MNKSVNETKPFYIWEGHYDTFQSAASKAIGPGFEGDIYLKRSLIVANECLDALKLGAPIPQFHKQRSTLLPLTVSMMLGHHERVRVLDFGGGLGIGYMTLVESILNDLEKIDYTIIENSEVCEAGGNLLGEVKYISILPKSNTFDLIHASSSLQYVEHWKDLLEKLTSFNPEYILLSDVFAGDIVTFVTLQNYYESRIPHWFLSLQELLDVMDKYGYRLIMKSYTASRRMNVEDVLPMDNFSETNRLPQTLHLLLQKK